LEGTLYSFFYSLVHEFKMNRTISSRESFATQTGNKHAVAISKIEKKINRKVSDTNLTSIPNSKFSIQSFLFPGLPEHYPLRKKIAITKANSTIGMMWDILLILLSVTACLTYVVDTYLSTYKQSQDILMIELVITQFFSVDFFLHWYIDGTMRYLMNSMVLVDLVTILPVYITLGVTTSTRLGFLRFIRILRLIRVFRTFKVLRNLSGIKRQIISLVLTLLSMTFLAAGIPAPPPPPLPHSHPCPFSLFSYCSSGMVQLMENDISQYRYDCQYINSKTYWEPSCSPNAPADDSCDCESNNCKPYYQRGDSPGHPTAIKCITLTYFEAFYFIVVTVSTVGYGDIAPTTT
jgi:tryptophan-rich sensory protein